MDRVAKGQEGHRKMLRFWKTVGLAGGLCALWALTPGHAKAQQVSLLPNGCGTANVNGNTSNLFTDPLGNLCLSGQGPKLQLSGGTAHTIAVANTAVVAATGPLHGCLITNPLSNTDEGIATAENLIVNLVGTASAPANGTNLALVPGASFSCPGGQTSNISAVAATAGHSFTLVVW